MERTISVQDLKARLWHGIDVTLVDVRRAAAREADPRLIPGAGLAGPGAGCSVGEGAAARSRSSSIACMGAEVSAGVVERLRELGFDAALLEGGFEGWKAAGGQLLARRACLGKRSARAKDEVVNEASQEASRRAIRHPCTPVSGAGRPERE